MVVTRTTRNRFVQRWARGFESHHLRHQTESGRNSRSRLFFYRNERLAFQPIETDLPPHQTESGCDSRSVLFFIEMRNSRFSQSKLTTLPTRLSLDAIRVPCSFYRNERLAFQSIETDQISHQTESGRSSRSKLFFIKMSSSRFSQSKLTLLPNGVFPEQKPHKNPTCKLPHRSDTAV